jgi:hypothetical protein
MTTDFMTSELEVKMGMVSLLSTILNQILEKMLG